MNPFGAYTAQLRCAGFYLLLRKFGSALLPKQAV
jgi:hypothetical protein